MFKNFYKNYVNDLSTVLNEMDYSKFEEIMSILEEACAQSHQVFVLGNGGSAAAATHWVCDMGKGINTSTSKRMRIMAPSDNGGILTALGNDVSYDDVFKYQLQSFANKDDIVICLSVSGSSPNLLQGAEYAKEKGCKVISIIGDYSGTLSEYSDILITIPSKNYGVVEDIHLIVNHIISQYMHKCNTERIA